MTTSQTRPAHHLHIKPSSYTSNTVVVTPHTPSSASLSTMRVETNDYYGPPTGVSDSFMFSVLCVFDFTSEEAGQLSFNKNEILEIIKCDNTGWWAAMRKEGSVVGWIPQAYVIRLPDDMVERLRNIREEFRVYEYEAEQLYNTAPVSRIAPLFDTDSATSSPLPEYEEYKANTPSTPHHNPREIAQPNARRDHNINPKAKDSPRCRPQPPPSPTSPMPHPPPTSEKRLKHTASSPNVDASRSQGASLSINRSIRRRPVMVEDNSTLTRLSTLIESKNTREIEKLASPDIAGSFEALSKRARENKPPKRKGSADARQIQTIIHIRPSYLQPQLTAQIDEDTKGHIRTATLPALIERLTTDMGPADLTKIAESSAFTNVFLMTFRTFMTADELFEALIKRYNMGPYKKLADNEYKDWKANLRVPTQHRILEIFSIWLEDHRLLEEEPHISQRLTNFLSTIRTPPHNTQADAIIKNIERLTFTVPNKLSTTATPKKPRKSKAHKNDLLKLDPADIAEQLALLEHALYAKVTPQECLAYAKTQTGEAVCKLQEFCSTHDKLGSWVKSSILNNEILGKRAGTVDFWIKVSEKCRLLNNFASMSAIIIALSSTAITGLHLTWAHVSRRSTLDALLRHNEPNGGFAGYRSLLQNVEGPCVPFITMYLTDIIHAQEHFANQDADGRIYFYQRARWYEITTNMLRFQNRTYSIAPGESTMNFIESHLREGVLRDQNWFWSKSQEVQHSELAHADIRKGLEAAGF
ncbi:ras guanine nucleotide exchange factor domain-containing protein [Flammula alnicola]|nr:ras guanine nucleotide exchange factor domain-containing protein [Flammula alnicola]